MRTFFVFVFFNFLVFSGCSSEPPPRLGGNDYWRQYDVSSMNYRAEQIARAVYSRFGGNYPLRSLTFKLRGSEAQKHSDVLLDFVSRTHNVGGVYYPSRAEFALEIVASPRALPEVSGAFNMNVNVRVIAIRPVAHGSQIIVQSRGQGQCSYHLMHFRRCDHLIGKIVSNIVYEMN